MTYIKKHARELLQDYKRMTVATEEAKTKEQAIALLSHNTGKSEVSRQCNISRPKLDRWLTDPKFSNKIRKESIGMRAGVKKDFDKIYVKLIKTLEAACEDKDNKSLGKIAEMVLKVKGVLTPDSSGNSFIFNSTDRVGKMLEMYAFMVNEYSLMNESERDRFSRARKQAEDVL